MDGLKIGLLAPHTGTASGPGPLREVAAAAEDLGFDSIWAGDHVVLPFDQTSRYPYGGDDADDSYEVPADRPFLEPLTTLSFLAGVTTRLSLGVSVAILPYRHPAIWAKSIATTQVLTEGRLILGAGVGWLEEEFRALGVDFRTRGRRVDETLRFLQEVWASDGPVTFKGDFVSVDEMHLHPPLSATLPPIWIGGNGAPSLRRTAALGDVWHPHIAGLTPTVLRNGLEQIRQKASADGREHEFEAAAHCPFVLSERPLGKPWDEGRIEGPAEHAREHLEVLREAGLSHVILTFGGSPTRRIGTMEALADALELR